MADPCQPPGASGPPHRGAGAARLPLTGAVGSADVPALCERANALLRDGEVGTLECDAGCVEGADLGTIEALARLALVTRRLARELRVRRASRELRELLDLAGLAEVVPCPAASGREARG